MISQVTAHLPVGASLGRLIIVGPGTILADVAGRSAYWRLDPGTVSRMMQVAPALLEMVSWSDGREVGRAYRRHIPATPIDDPHADPRDDHLGCSWRSVPDPFELLTDLRAYG